MKNKIKIWLIYHFKYTKVKLKLYTKALPIYLFVIACLSIIAYFTDKWVEAFFQIVALLCLRYKFDTTYHAKKSGTCLFITLSIGYIAIPLIPKTNVNLFGGIIVAFAIAFVSWLLQAFIDVRIENKNIKEKNIILIKENEKLLNDNKKSIEEMTDNEFIKYCQHKHLTDCEIKIAELFIRQNLKGQEFYEAIGYSVSQSKRIRKKILEKLNS